jgi:hypothetical protein
LAHIKNPNEEDYLKEKEKYTIALPTIETGIEFQDSENPLLNKLSKRSNEDTDIRG